MLADLRGWSRFVSLQVRYSLLDRAVERDLLPMARSLGLAVTPWSVLGSGLLTGKYQAGSGKGEGGNGGVQGRAARWEKRERDLSIAGEVVAVAEEMGCTPSQVAINWVCQQGGNIIPLIGTRSLEQLQDNLAALEHPLGAEQLARLDAASAIELGLSTRFPGLGRNPRSCLRRNL